MLNMVLFNCPGDTENERGGAEGGITSSWVFAIMLERGGRMLGCENMRAPRSESECENKSESKRTSERATQRGKEGGRERERESKRTRGVSV